MEFELLNNISGAVVLLCVTVSFSMLYEPRYSKKKYLASLIPFLLILFAVNFYVIFKYGFAEYGKVTVAIATIPSLIYFFITSKNRDGRFFFTFCLVDTSSILMALFTGIIDYYCHGEGIVNFVLRIILAVVLAYLVYKFVRPNYLNLLHTVTKGWWIFTAITSIAYVLLILVTSYPTSLRERPQDIPVAIVITILLPLMYFNIFYVLIYQQKVYDMDTIQHAFTAQSAMMKSRADELRSAEEKLRLERHDLRHRLKLIEELALKDDKEELLKYVGYVQKSFDEMKLVHYCQNPILDAIISHYTRVAKENGIEVEEKLSIPDELPVQPVELATVFANLFENAINANLNIEDGKRKIEFTCISYPSLMFEMKNPYTGKIEFDIDGLPMARKEGHGIGTRSVLAFCKKYDSGYLYEAKDGTFRVMITF